METVIKLIQNLMVPQLQKDNHFSHLELSTTFWNEFASQLIQFEEEAQPLYATIYKLKLQDPERLISKIPEYYNVIVKELAEHYVLDHISEPIEYLLKVQNEQFLKEVQSLKMLQQAIKKVERKRLKDELPSSYNRLVFELSENEVELATKKKGREDLKIKMQQWSKELESEEALQTNYSIQPQENRKIDSRTKVISLSWVKYAVAAIFIIGLVLWQPSKLTNDALYAQYTNESSIAESIDYNKLLVNGNVNGVRGTESSLHNYSEIETAIAMDAVLLLKNGNYERAKENFKSLQPKGKNNNILFFLALSQLKTSDIDQAVSNLEYLNKIEYFDFKDEVKFYLALSYLKVDKTKKAKLLLKSISTSNSIYNKKSKKIIDKMRWF